ncbi:MAG: prepilin-type N-terminal cleavage/methylation domain-containing protein [Verrucomicrobia subdivision 3 bacterium]|nr:prepilin-type N-terminal cleavage/methylation domain-containing protein [Limisphaerales bacterium]
MQRESRAAFTLIELLVVMAVIAILASLLMPAIASAKKRARNTQCLSNLKQIGVATQLYLQDSEGVLQLDALIPGSNTWATILATNVGLGASDVFVCPDYKPFRFKNWITVYGIRVDPPPQSASGPGRVFFRVDSAGDPSEYLLVGDTTSQAQGGYTAYNYYKFNVSSALRLIHARHFGRANGLFLDGHVEACNKPRLEGLGINAEYGPDTAVGYFD